MAARTETTPLGEALAASRWQFASVGAFSGVANLLQLTVPLYMMMVFDRVLAARSGDTLFFLTAIALFALLVLALLEGVRSLVMQRVAAWMEMRAAPETFHRGLEAQLRGLPYRMEALRDLAACRSYLGSGGALALYDLPWVPVYLAVIFLLHPLLGLVALAGALLLFGLTVLSELVTSRLLREAATAAQRTQSRTEAMARNAEVIDSMGMAPAVLARWRAGINEVLPAQTRAGDRAAVILAATKFCRLAVQLAVLGVGAWLTLRQQVTPGASIAASIVMGRALAPVEQVIGGWRQLVQARQSFQRLQAFLRMPPGRPAGTAPPPPRGRLELERVTYGFPGTAAPLIKGISLQLEPGEALAVIGPSAAGKTTLIRLIMGTLPPNAGTARLDGADVFLWPREDFGRHVGYLPQAVELFDGSVFQNIARMGAAAPEQVFEAARLAGCHEMILRLPRGYDTEIGEGGQHLSGGQRQMIGLARALFGNPKLIVLDEPNSNLDGESEAILLHSLARAKQAGATLILVSHRPGLVQVADKVLVLRDGAAELYGPRAEVMKRLMAPPRPTEMPPPGAKPALTGTL
ncbi:type I secretion system permease/ATPase [Roseococcus suduntuyensis]|nr:type I secretion system permease/ATPase [Roseococcus suduntuyensis]